MIDILGPAAIGVFTAGGIVLANIAAGLGIAGISNSIIHCSLVIVTLFNYFVLNQLLSFEQFIGVMLTMVGGLLIAVGEKVTSCGKDADENEDYSPDNLRKRTGAASGDPK